MVTRSPEAFGKPTKNQTNPVLRYTCYRGREGEGREGEEGEEGEEKRIRKSWRMMPMCLPYKHELLPLHTALLIFTSYKPKKKLQLALEQNKKW